MLRAVIFDFDGVLVDSELLHFEAFSNILSPLGVKMSKQQYFDKYLGLSDEELVRTVNQEQKLTLSESQLEQLLRQKASVFKELVVSEASIIDGVPAFLQMLADNKIPLAVYSGALKAEIELILKGAGLRDFFEALVSAEQVKKGKPDPEGFLLALQLLNKKTHQKILPQDCIVIEDSNWGLQAAKAAGMHPVAVTNSYAADYLRPADKIIENLSELTLDDLQTLCR
ncbi:MAG: HAD family phosphatase [Planctomycetota bacterium]